MKSTRPKTSLDSSSKPAGFDATNEDLRTCGELLVAVSNNADLLAGALDTQCRTLVRLLELMSKVRTRSQAPGTDLEEPAIAYEVVLSRILAVAQSLQEAQPRLQDAAGVAAELSVGRRSQVRS